MRCVREIVRSQKCDESSWLLITWEAGIPGVTMTPCSRLEDARNSCAHRRRRLSGQVGAVAGSDVQGKRRTAFRHPPIALNLHRHAVCSLLFADRALGNPPQPPYPTDLGGRIATVAMLRIGVSRRTSDSP